MWCLVVSCGVMCVLCCVYCGVLRLCGVVCCAVLCALCCAVCEYAHGRTRCVTEPHCDHGCVVGVVLLVVSTLGHVDVDGRDTEGGHGVFGAPAWHWSLGVSLCA